MVSVAARSAEPGRDTPEGQPGHDWAFFREGSMGRMIVHAHAAAIADAIQNCQSPTGKLTRFLPRYGMR